MLRSGRWTLGLYNSYDPKSFHETMRRALARAAPLCQGFGFNLAAIGFPFEAFRDGKGQPPRRIVPAVIASLVAASTSIGEGGAYLERLAAEGRFLLTPFPSGGFPPQLGTPVLATRKPDPKKRASLRDLVFRTREGESFLFLVGLGPRGVPKSVHETAALHLELTGGDYSLETATAMGVLVGRLAEAQDQVLRPNGPALTADALVRRGDEVLLVRRAREPFKGSWAIPGGFVNPGESVQDAALRELREETGLDARLTELVGIFSKPGRDPRGPVVSVVFRAESGGTPRAADDAEECRFFPWDALPRLAFDHDEILRVARSATTKPQP